jgi:hypothetical protein
MNPTETRAAAVFFAEFLLPLHYANARRNMTYIDRRGCGQSRWDAVASRTGGMEQVCGAACDARALLASLADYWAERKDTNLLQLLPHLEALLRDLNGGSRPDEQEGVSDFVYPLF